MDNPRADVTTLPHATVAVLAALGAALSVRAQGTETGADPAAPRAGAPVRRIVLLEPDVFPDRPALLRRLRSAIDARNRAAADAAVEALDQGCRAAQQPLRQWVEARGGTVQRPFWIIPGAAVELPATAAAQLPALPGVARVVDDVPYPASLRICTDANNHNADYVQSQLGIFGTGTALALLDSGVDLDVNIGGNSAPHPAFDRRPPGSGTRIRKAIGIAAPGDAEDLNGHGSAVAAIALAIDWNGAFGYSDDGFAPDAELVSYKVTAGTGLSVLESNVVAAWQQTCADRLAYNIVVANHSFAGSPDPASPAQQALDQTVLTADVLPVVAAGNDGQTAIPTAQSPACPNGLAVGAITADAGQPTPHRVTSFSSFGPLPGDGGRFYPDLVACGDSVVSIKINVPNGITFNPGTSFAAPMVAGTALLLRGAAPALSALDTKALLLDNVADVSAQNPGLGRSYYGLGMLRTDLAVEAVTRDTLLHGQLDPQQGITEASYPVSAQAQTDYAATLAWLNTTPGTADWDDLDLAVIAPNGKTIAVSDSPRNLYERVLFRAAATGTYTLRVTGVSFAAGGGPHTYALVFGDNRGGGRQAGSYDRYGTGCLGSAGDPAGGLVLPAVAAGTSGNARTRVPFSHYTTRLQQAFDGSAFATPRTVSSIAFRRDEQQPGSPGYDISLEMLLGYTARAPGTLQPQFQANVAGTMTQVIGFTTVRFPGTQGLPTGPGQFDWRLPLDHPFTVQPPAGQHLLWETRVYGHTQGNQPFGLYFDAVRGQGYGRVYTDGMPMATQGLVDDVSIVASFAGGVLPPIAPDLQADGLPQLGATFTAVLRHAAPGAPAALLHGGSRTVWGGVALPFDLSPLGAPGCLLQTDAVLVLPVGVRADGTAEVPYVIPLDPGLTGETFFHQFAVFDPAANALGLTVSGAARALIGG